MCVRCMFCLKSGKRRNIIYLYVYTETLERYLIKYRWFLPIGDRDGGGTGQVWKKPERRLLAGDNFKLSSL